MTYQEILEVVNNYLIVTGIRHFCRNTCQGQCCSDPRLQCNNAIENYSSIECETRLPCSLYLCDYVEAYIINYIENGEQIVDLLREIDLIICEKIRKIEETTFIYKLNSETHLNLVFDIPDISLLLNPIRQEVFFNGNID